MRADLVFFAGIITLVSPIPYVRDSLKGKTHPNLVTWFTWTLLNGITAAAAWSTGAKQTAIFMTAAAIATFAIVLSGLKYGLKRYTKFDISCQATALVGLTLWGITSNPAVAVAINVATDFVGLLPTIRHAWKSPHSETWQTFAIAMAAGALTLISIQNYTFISLASPIYIFFADTTMLFVILSRRRKDHELS
jgi:hypothetical protein